jgi:uncharacterized repeat protein (TIGR02543 family)
MTSSKKIGRNRLLILLAGAILMSLVLAISSAQTAKAAPTTPDLNGVTHAATPTAQKYTGQIVVQPTGMKVTVSPTPPAGKGPHPMDLPFGPNVQVTSDPLEDSRPSMAIYPNIGSGMDGVHYIVYQHYNGADWDIYWAYSVDGSAWTAGQFSATPAVDETNPSIAITSAGTVVVAWQDASQPTYLMFAHSPDGVTFNGYYLDIGTMWSGTMTDIQFVTVIAQRNTGTYTDGIMFQGQAYCTAATGCEGGAHTAFWMGEQFANDITGWTLGLGGFRWNVCATPAGTGCIPDPLHPSAWWGSNDYTQAMDMETVDGTQWIILWIYMSEDSGTVVNGWQYNVNSNDGIFASGASDGLNAVLAGSFRLAADPSRHQILAFSTTDGWVSTPSGAPLDPATTDQRAVAVAGVGTSFHITYYSGNVMTDMASTDTGGAWTGPQKVSDNAGSAVNDLKATTIFIDYGGAPKVAWQDNRDGNVNIYTTGYITYQFWLNSTCGGTASTMSLLIDDILPVQTPYTAKWSPGSTHTVRAQPPTQQADFCKQCTFTQWNDGSVNPLKSIDVTGSFSLEAQFSAKYRVQLDTNPTGLQVTWKGLSHTAQYVTYESPQTYTADAPSPQNGMTPDQHYVFVDWSDGITTRTRNVVVGTACLNLTANFGLEYQITIQTNPGGLKVGFDTTPLADAPVTFWSASGVSHMLITTSPQLSGLDTRFRFDRWAGGPTTWGWNVTIPGANTYTANFITQYLIQIRANIESPGPTVGSDIPGCDVQMPAPLRCWADASSSPSLIIFTPQGTAGSRYTFTDWIDGDLRISRPIGPITAPASYTSMWDAEYYLTMALDSNTCLGSVTPGSGWHIKGDPVNIDWVAPTGVPAGEQYRFWKWVGSGLGNYTGGSQSAQVTMNDAVTETAYCHHEFQTTLDTSPVALDYTVDTIVQANGLRPFWWEYNSVHWFNVTQTTQGGATTQYIFQDWSGNPNPNHAYTVLSSNSFTANFQPQYKITLGQIPASPAGLGGLACSNVDCWYDEGESATVSVTSPWPSTTDPQYVFAQWSGSVPPGTTSTSYTFSSMNAPKTATANWIIQYKITVITVHGTATCSNANCWYQAGTQATITLDATVPGTTGTRYAFTAWSGDATGSTLPLSITMDSNKTVTAGWQTQYLLTVTSNCGTTACGDPIQINTDGWYDADDDATVTVTTPATVGDKTYDFTAWTGDSTAATAATTVTMDAPKSITATWTEKVTPSQASDLMVWIILIVVIIVVVALVLFLVMRRKKPPVEEELPPEEIPPAPPMRQAPPARPAAPPPAKPAPPAQRPVAPPPQKK